MDTSNKLSYLLSGLGLVALAAGVILSMFPLWKSATLSPDSIERRVYWTGTTIAVLLFSLSALPNWRTGLFVFFGGSLAILAISFMATKHIKINGRISARSATLRTPDRPPALTRDSDGTSDEYRTPPR